MTKNEAVYLFSSHSKAKVCNGKYDIAGDTIPLPVDHHAAPVVVMKSERMYRECTYMSLLNAYDYESVYFTHTHYTTD